MTVAQWLQVQEQLWSAFGPLIAWWLASLLAGLLGGVTTIFGAIFFQEWLNG